jgi:hypothetical protein
MGDWDSSADFIGCPPGARCADSRRYQTSLDGVMQPCRKDTEQLTGRTSDDVRNEVWRVSSWGKKAALIGAPLRGSMCISNACLEAPIIYFESSGLENFRFDKYQIPATGLIGNAPFVDQYTVAIDLHNERFGLYRGSLAGAN